MSNPDEVDRRSSNCESQRNAEDENESVMNFNLQGNTGDIDENDDRLQLIKRMMSLTFTDIHEADQYYFRYGQLTGFDIRKHSLKRKKTDLNIVLNRVWVCTRAGNRDTRIKDYDRSRAPKEDKRCGCPAIFRIALDRSTGIYRVTTFNPDHSHRLETPDTSHILRCNRLMSNETKNVLQLMTDVGMKPSHVIDFLDEACAGNQTRLFNRKDAYNYLNGERLKRIEGGDANTMLGLLNGMKVNDKSIEYQHSVDANNALTKIFWCDGISRAEYENFGDVILFDSTYKTNMYRFPIVLLSGVNSHLWTCIFGVAIMYKETTQQYTWLLRTFQKFMNGKAPTAVLTDQDAAMCAAIRDVFPKATHRLCCWHISRNAETTIKIPGFSTCFSKLMKSTCSVAQFEARWSTLIAKFGVADHPWIQDIYSKRHLWAEAFFRGKFFSMMRSTQRAESMNASLKQKVSSGCSLTDLFRQYNNNFLKRIRKRFHVLQKESENPPRKVKRTGLLSGLENHVGRVCTRAIFDYIQKELKEEANIIVLNKSVPVNRRHTFIFEDHSKARPRTFTTVIDLDNEEFQCECSKLESDGIPCRHLICGFKNLTLIKFPDKSIHPRWFVDVGKNLTSRFSYLDPTMKNYTALKLYMFQ